MNPNNSLRVICADNTENREKPLPGSIVKKTFLITNWKTWDDEVDTAVRVFKNKFLLYPEIFLANFRTHARIDMAAKTLHLERFTDSETGAILDTPPDTGIAVFQGENYSLEFCVDDGMPDGCFALIYDPDPDGGEPCRRKTATRVRNGGAGRGEAVGSRKNN